MNESMPVIPMHDDGNFATVMPATVTSAMVMKGRQQSKHAAGAGGRLDTSVHDAGPAGMGRQRRAAAPLRAAFALAASALMLPLVSALSGVTFGVAQAAEQATQPSPQEIVTQVAQQTVEELDAHRAEYRKDPRRLRELIDRIMLPHFDTQYSAQLVLAKHWRSATADQRKRFIEAFYQSMLQSYGEALLEFTPDRLRILPYQGKADDRIATVRSEVRRDDGSRVPVNYALRKTAEGWKAFDVQIEGVSYVKSLRTDFGAEIDRNGLESVIARLESQVAAGTARGAADKPTAPAQSSSQSSDRSRASAT